MSRNIIVINVDLRETRVALIEGGVISELHIERAAQRGTVGNVVLGRVTRVLPGMQAAFIDVGQERAAFLHVEDLIRPADFDAYLSANPVLNPAAKGEVIPESQRPEPPESVETKAEPAPVEEPLPAERSEDEDDGHRPIAGFTEPPFSGPADEFDQDDYVDVERRKSLALNELLDLDADDIPASGYSDDESDDDESDEEDDGQDGEDDADDESDEDSDHDSDDDESDDEDSDHDSDDEDSDDEDSDGDADDEDEGDDDDSDQDEYDSSESDSDEEDEDADDQEESDVESSDQQDDESDQDEDDDDQDEDDSSDDEQDEERPQNKSLNDEAPESDETPESGEDSEEATSEQDAEQGGETIKRVARRGRYRRRGGRGRRRRDADTEESPSEDSERTAAASSDESEEQTEEQPKDGRRRRRRGRRRGERVVEASAEETSEEANDDEDNGRRGSRRRRRRRGRRRGSDEAPPRAAAKKKSKADLLKVPPRVSRSVPITEVVREGDQVVVQISKEPIGTKGARVTSHVSLPGRYVVYLPTVEHTGISKRIGQGRERVRLRKVIDSLKPATGGLIVRTVAEGLTKKQLKADVGYLIKVWAQIADKRRSAKARDTLYEELDLVLKVARDYFTDQVHEVVIDDREQYGRLVRFVEMFMPARVKDIKLYTGDEPVFDAYGIEDEIKRALSRKVPLPSGGSLIMDQAEALTAIDVNTGRYVGKGSKDLEETALKTNLEAVDEIAYQLRFRNIGGLVILDLIDMERSDNREKVWRALEQRLAKDKAKTTINRISELGLIEMTRKRTRESLGRIMNESCFYCDGTGQIQSRETIAYEILRQIRRERHTLPGYSVRVSAHPAVIDFLKHEAKVALDEAERRYMRRIELNPRQEYHIEQYDLQGR